MAIDVAASPSHSHDASLAVPGTKAEKLRANLHAKTAQLRADLARLRDERDAAGAALQRAIGPEVPHFGEIGTVGVDSNVARPANEALAGARLRANEELIQLMQKQLEAVARERDEAWARAEAIERSLERERLAAREVAAQAVQAQDDGKAGVKEVLRQLAASEAQSAALRASLEEERSRSAALEEALSRTAASNDADRSGLLREVQEQLAAAFCQGEELQRRLAGASDPQGCNCCQGQEQLASAEASCAAAEVECAALRRDFEASERLKAEALEQLAEAEAKFAASEARLTSVSHGLESRAKALEKELADFQAKFAAAEVLLSSQSCHLEQRATVAEKLLTETQGKFAAAEASNAAVLRDLERAEKLKEEASACKLADVQAELEAAETRHTNASLAEKQQAEAASQSLAEMEAKLADSEAQQAALSCSFHQARTLHTEVAAHGEAQQALLTAEFEERAEVADQRLAHCKAELECAMAQHVTTTRELTQHRLHVDSAEQSLAKVESELAASEAKQADMLKSCEQAKLLHTEGEGKLSEIEIELAENRAQLLATEQSHAALKAEFEEDRSRLEAAAEANRLDTGEHKQQLAGIRAEMLMAAEDEAAMARSLQQEHDVCVMLRSELVSANRDITEARNSVCAAESLSDSQAWDLERERSESRMHQMQLEMVSMERDELLERQHSSSEAVEQLKDFKSLHIATKAARDALQRALESEQQASRHLREQLQAANLDRDPAMALAEAASRGISQGDGENTSTAACQDLVHGLHGGMVAEEPVQREHGELKPGLKLRQALREVQSAREDDEQLSSASSAAHAVVPRPLPPLPLTPPPEEVEDSAEEDDVRTLEDWRQEEQDEGEEGRSIQHWANLDNLETQDEEEDGLLQATVPLLPPPRVVSLASTAELEAEEQVKLSSPTRHGHGSRSSSTATLTRPHRDSTSSIGTSCMGTSCFGASCVIAVHTTSPTEQAQPSPQPCQALCTAPLQQQQQQNEHLEELRSQIAGATGARLYLDASIDSLEPILSAQYSASEEHAQEPVAVLPAPIVTPTFSVSTSRRSSSESAVSTQPLPMVSKYRGPSK